MCHFKEDDTDVVLTLPKVHNLVGDMKPVDKFSHCRIEYGICHKAKSNSLFFGNGELTRSPKPAHSWSSEFERERDSAPCLGVWAVSGQDPVVEFGRVNMEDRVTLLLLPSRYLKVCFLGIKAQHLFQDNVPTTLIALEYLHFEM